MQLLDAAIAFALTLAGLATVVSIVVEIIHRALSLRSEGLRAMLVQHFEDVIVPAIKTKVEQAVQGADDKLAQELDHLREDLLEKMTANPLVILQKSSWLPKRAVKALARYNEVTALDFLKRLPETKVYAYINLPEGNALGQHLKKFDQKYEEYEKAISNFFKRRAQLLSFAVGIILAIAVNIHGIRLFERYLNDPELTAAVISQTDKIESAMAAAQKRQGTGPAATDAENLKEIKNALDQYHQVMGDFMGLGLPIGWRFYPNCPEGGQAAAAGSDDPQCRTVPGSQAAGAAGKNSSTAAGIFRTVTKDPWGFLKWLLVVVITGTLIGLGGPFWFDVASKLGGFRRKLRGDADKAPPGPSGPGPDDDHDAVIEKITADTKSRPAVKKKTRKKKTNQIPGSKTTDT